MDRLKRFYINGLLMTCVTLLIRYLGVRFNVYISERIGSVSMGIFTLISSVYAFALTIATSGIGLATTKLVSQAMGKSQSDTSYPKEATISAILKKSLLLSLFISCASAALLYFGSALIGTRILRDSRTVSSMKILSFSLPPIALSSSLGGYFTAVRRVERNALVQIASQLLRIFLCVFLLERLVANDFESACIALVWGILLSEVVAFLFHAFMYLRFKSSQKNRSETRQGGDKALANMLLPITIPVALSAYVRSALVTIEHLLIPIGLEKSGTSRGASLSAYGTIHSIVFPFVLFPSAISSSFAGLLIPEISESAAAGDNARINRIISRVLKTVIIYSVGISGVMICLSAQMSRLLFSDFSTAIYIPLVAPLVPIMYLDTSVDSILKGLGYQFYSMVVNITDAFLSVILVCILLPKYGIWGYLITVYFTEIVNASLSVTKLLCVTKAKIGFTDFIFKPLLSIFIATRTVTAILDLIFPRSLSPFWLIIGIILVVIAYLGALVVFKAIYPKKIKAGIKNFWSN